MTWLEILRGLLFYGKALQEKTRKTCPNPNCPLKLNTKEGKITTMTQDEMIRRQEELFKRNHTKKAGLK